MPVGRRRRRAGSVWAALPLAASGRRGRRPCRTPSPSRRALQAFVPRGAEAPSTAPPIRSADVDESVHAVDLGRRRRAPRRAALRAAGSLRRAALSTVSRRSRRRLRRGCREQRRTSVAATGSRRRHRPTMYRNDVTPVASSSCFLSIGSLPRRALERGVVLRLGAVPARAGRTAPPPPRPGGAPAAPTPRRVVRIDVALAVAEALRARGSGRPADASAPGRSGDRAPPPWPDRARR